MADRQRRRLERLAASGDCDAGARLIQERLRGGEVCEEGIELAAWLGDPGSLALRPWAGAPPGTTLPFLAYLVEGFSRWGRWLHVRAALELARWLAPPQAHLLRREQWQGSVFMGKEPLCSASELLKSVQIWLNHPNDSSAEEVYHWLMVSYNTPYLPYELAAATAACAVHGLVVSPDSSSPNRFPASDATQGFGVLRRALLPFALQPRLPRLPDALAWPRRRKRTFQFARAVANLPVMWPADW